MEKKPTLESFTLLNLLIFHSSYIETFLYPLFDKSSKLFMTNHLSIIIIGINFYVLIKCSIVQTQKIDNNNETCVENQFQIGSMNHLKVCYFNDIQNRSILVWFTIEESLQDTFDFYRFILRSMDNLLSSNIIIEILTNFTELIDFSNSLRMFNLDSGRYEVCIEFQSNFSKFIYRPRDGCISIQIGRSSYVLSKENPTPLLIALATGIVLFFILGLIVQWAKVKRKKKVQDDVNKPRSRSSSVLSTISLRQKHDSLIRNFFHRHIDQPRSSHMHQWVLNRVLRHRILTEEQEFERPRSFQKWTKQFFTSTDQSSRTQTIPSSEPNLPTTIIYTTTEKEHHQIPSRKISFDLPPPEEYEMTSEN